jgi:hypothetical protein
VNNQLPSYAISFASEAKALFRFAVRMTSWPSGDQNILQIGPFYVRVNGTTGRIGIGTNAALQQSAAVAVDSSWHVMEIQADLSANPWTINWKLDGVAQTAWTPANAASSCQSWAPGSGVTSAVWTAQYDDLVVGAFTSTSDWYGDGKVLGYSPASDGTHAAGTSIFGAGDGGTGYTNATTTAYTMVDDVPFPGPTARSTTDNICQTANGTTNYMELAIGGASESGTPNCVSWVMGYGSPGTASNTGGCILRNSGGSSQVLWGDLPVAQGGGGGALANYSGLAAASSVGYKAGTALTPAGGWSASEINALRVRFGGSGDANPDLTLQAVMIEADWPPSGTEWTANPNDSTSISDSINSFGWGPGIDDSTALSDAQTKIETKELVPSDTVTPTDAQSFDYSKSGLNDTETPTDSASAARGLVVLSDDTETPTDSITSFGRGTEPADTETPTDAQNFGYGPGLADTETPTDAQNFGYGPGLADTETPTDGTSQQTGKEATPADSTSISDAQSFDRQQSAADSTSLTDAQVISQGFGLTVGDSSSMSDSVSTVLAFLQATNDTQTLSDALSASQGYNLPISDLTALSDALVTSQGHVRALADSLTASDFVYFDRQQAITDAVTLADQQAKGFGPGVAEALVVVDSTATSRGLAALIDDAAALTDAVVTYVPGSVAPYTHTQMPQGGQQLTGQTQSGTTVLLVYDGVITVYEASGISLPYDADGDSQ